MRFILPLLFFISVSAYADQKVTGDLFVTGKIMSSADTSYKVEVVNDDSGTFLVTDGASFPLFEVSPYSFTSTMSAPMTCTADVQMDQDLNVDGLITGNIDSAQFAYVATTGSDATGKKNDTSLPFKTLTAAFAAIYGNGTIYVGPGVYAGESLNLADTTFLHIIGSQNGRTRFRFGKQYSSFTNVSGVQWRAAIQEAITYVGTANPASVHELSTPYGAITNHHPVDRGYPYRMESTPLTYYANPADVAGGNGRWSFDANYIYVSCTTGCDPNTEYYQVSAQDSSASIVYGGTMHKAARIQIDNIEVEYPYDGFLITNVASAKLSRVVVQGATNNGIHGFDNGVVEISYAEVSDVGNDAINFKGTQAGSNYITSNLYRKPYISILDPWVHDSYDKGIVAHERTTIFVRGGLIESAPYTITGMSGVLAFAGGDVFADGVTVRGFANSEAFATGGSISGNEGSDGIYLRVHNSVVEGSRIGFRGQMTGTLVVYNSTVIGNTSMACYGASATARVDCTGVVSVGDGGLINNFAYATCKNCTVYTTSAPEGAIEGDIGNMAYVTTGTPNVYAYVKTNSGVTTTGWKKLDLDASLHSTNGVNYYNGTNIISGTGFVYTGTNVGIGISSPAEKLDIVGKTRMSSTATVTNIAANQEIGALDFYYNDDSYLAARVGARIVASTPTAWETSSSNYNSDLRFYTLAAAAAATEKMRLDEDGYLGINTTTPATHLDVNGEVVVRDTNTGANAGTALCLGANNTICVCGTCN